MTVTVMVKPAGVVDRSRRIFFCLSSMVNRTLGQGMRADWAGTYISLGGFSLARIHVW